MPAAVCEEWPIDGGCLPEVSTPEEQAALDAAKDLAVDVLWALSGRQFGVCPAVARPCPLQRNPLPSVSLLYSSGWRDTSCGCAGRCVSSGPRMVHLPGPVQSIVEVTVEGVIQDPSEYQLEGDTLYRNGESWPCQDLSRPLGEDHTWSVTYMRGLPVPQGLGRLTGLLVNEFYLACTGGKCRLPRTVTEVSRQGVTHRMFDTNQIYASGKTGIPEIDLWLAAVNPHHLMQAPTVV